MKKTSDFPLKIFLCSLCLKKKGECYCRPQKKNVQVQGKGKRGFRNQ